MKTPVDVVEGRIVDYDENGILTIKAKYDDWRTLTRREYRKCTIHLKDSRRLSDKQRRACYALIKAISEFSGMGTDAVKEWTKLKFIVEDLERTADEMFSLSDAPMSLVCAYQKFLIHFIIDWDVPCNFPLINYVDDVEDYVYYCATHRKCAVCGRDAVLHHWDRIAMGRDRDEIDQVGMRAEPLCSIHHNEAHTMGRDDFDAKYHIKPIVIDQALKKIWRIGGTRKRADKKGEN